MKHIILLALFIASAFAVNAQCPVYYRIVNNTSCPYCVRIKYTDCSGWVQFTYVTAAANTQNQYTLTFAHDVTTVIVYDASMACPNNGTNANLSAFSTSGSVEDCGGTSTNIATWQSDHETWIN